MPLRSFAPIVRALLFLGAYLVVLRVTSVSQGLVPPALASLTWGALASLGLLGLTRGMTRLPGRDGSVRIASGSIGQFAQGAALGIAVYSLILATTALVVGPLRITAAPPPALGTTLVMVLGFLALACMEELGFRGYPLRTLAASSGKWTALLVVSLAFAASHALFGWPWQTILLGVLPSGVLFGIGALVSGGLALPIGLHAAVNVARWITGEQGTPGFLMLSLDPAHVARAALLAPGIGATVPLLVGAALWRWYPRPQVRPPQP